MVVYNSTCSEIYVAEIKLLTTTDLLNKHVINTYIITALLKSISEICEFLYLLHQM